MSYTFTNYMFLDPRFKLYFENEAIAEETKRRIISLVVQEQNKTLAQNTARHIDFSNIAHMDPHIAHYWLGLNSSQFNNLLDLIPQLREMVSCASAALSILLVKLRTGESKDFHHFLK